MITKKVLISISFLLLTINSISAQRPPHEDNAELFNRLDENKNGTIERIEFTADADAIFKNFDRSTETATRKARRFSIAARRAIG
jgi:hypothetical protein